MNTVKTWASEIKAVLNNTFFGNEDLYNLLFVPLLCEGHILIDDVPGVGKSLLARTLAGALGGTFSQIACTPDLLPSDILGVSIYDEAKNGFLFRKGPIMANIVLVDEINRATPRTQSALLEAIAEGQISVEGKSLPLPEPFFLIATESPLDQEGTFPLPEVQKDRFFLTMKIGYPEQETERKIMKSHDPEKKKKEISQDFSSLLNCREEILKVHVAPQLRHYILQVVNKTRNDSRLIFGVSPRGSLAIYKGAQAMAALNDREYVTPEDIKTVIYPVLNKRIHIHPEWKLKGVTEELFIDEILSEIPVPLTSETD